MNAKKRLKPLALNRETIRELQRDELSAAAGGMGTIANCTGNFTLPLTVCECTGNYTYQCG